MSIFPIKYKPFGESALLMEWPAEMSEDILNEILLVYHNIKSKPPPSIIDIVQSINSITLFFDSELGTHTELEQWIKELKISADANNKQRYKWTIPVCYDTKYAADIEYLAKHNSLTIEEIISLHTSAIYSVYSIGFLPGFLYLGGLDERLHISRKSNPALKVPQGAVGIGGQQTGVYPMESPGGWHIIGQTPILFFDKEKENPCFAKPGDQIQFLSISSEEYDSLKQQVLNDSYELIKEVIDD